MNPTCQLSVCGFPKVNKLVIKPISTSDLDVLRKANATQKKRCLIQTKLAKNAGE